MSDEPRIKFKVSLSIGISNAEQSAVIDSGYTVAEWSAMSKEERAERAHQAWEEWIWEYIDGGADVVEDE